MVVLIHDGSVTLRTSHFGLVVSEVPVSQISLFSTSLSSWAIGRRWLEHQRILKTSVRVWKSNYLVKLQIKSKWFTENEIVIIKEDSKAASDWNIGRIIELLTGPYRYFPVANVKMSNGILKKPVSKLIPLKGVE